MLILPLPLSLVPLVCHENSVFDFHNSSCILDDSMASFQPLTTALETGGLKDLVQVLSIGKDIIIIKLYCQMLWDRRHHVMPNHCMHARH